MFVMVGQRNIQGSHFGVVSVLYLLFASYTSSQLSRIMRCEHIRNGMAIPLKFDPQRGDSFSYPWSVLSVTGDTKALIVPLAEPSFIYSSTRGTKRSVTLPK